MLRQQRQLEFFHHFFSPKKIAEECFSFSGFENFKKLAAISSRQKKTAGPGILRGVIVTDFQNSRSVKAIELKSSLMMEHQS